MAEYLTVKEAAARFQARGVTEPRLRRWISTGRLPAYERKFDGLTLVKPEEVEAVIKSLEEVVPKGEE